MSYSARIESIYHGSCQDGEGIRSVVFFMGCTLSCPFCHNPECLHGDGKLITLDELMDDILRYKTFIKGVTLSGGEPFLWARFCGELAQQLHINRLTCIAETNGTIDDERLLKHLDSVRLDIKNYKGESAKAIAKNYSRFMTAAKRFNVPVHATTVLVPEVNDTPEALEQLAIAMHKLKIKEIELLPFRKLCEEKYASLDREFKYSCYREATAADLVRAHQLIVDKLHEL